MRSDVEQTPRIQFVSCAAVLCVRTSFRNCCALFMSMRLICGAVYANQQFGCGTVWVLEWVLLLWFRPANVPSVYDITAFNRLHDAHRSIAVVDGRDTQWWYRTSANCDYVCVLRLTSIASMRVFAVTTDNMELNESVITDNHNRRVTLKTPTQTITCDKLIAHIHNQRRWRWVNEQPGWCRRASSTW